MNRRKCPCSGAHSSREYTELLCCRDPAAGFSPRNNPHYPPAHGKIMIIPDVKGSGKEFLQDTQNDRYINAVNGSPLNDKPAAALAAAIDDANRKLGIHRHRRPQLRKTVRLRQSLTENPRFRRVRDARRGRKLSF